jgi:predicted nucleic acid-binding protein
MKKLILLTFFLYGLFLSAQSQIDPALKNMQLYDGSVYVTYGHRITQVFSELTFNMGVGVFPKTNIAYLSYQQLIVLMQDSSKRENRSQEDYIAARNNLKTHAAGGRIILYIERFDLYATNNKFLFIIIRDKNDQKIYEYNLPARPAQLVTGDVFSNWAFIDIPVALPDEFYVYVNHKMTDYLSDTKFLVQTNAAPVNKPKEEQKEQK